MDLKSQVLADRVAYYHRLRGGFPIPLAGTVFWAVIGLLGYFLPFPTWLFITFIGTGSIFPLALLFAKLFGNNFMKESNAVSGAIVPAFISMLLLWPLVLGAMQVAPELAILILAIGMSAHWPVIGWTYGRTALYSAHSIVRAIVCLGLWTYMPDDRMTLLPLAVAAIYLLTVIAIYIDSGNRPSE